MRRNWYNSRTIDTLMVDYGNIMTMPGIAFVLTAGSLAVFAIIFFVFYPIFGIIQSLEHSMGSHFHVEPPNVLLEAIVMLLALLSVILSICGLRKYENPDRKKRIAIYVVCALCLFALVLSTTATFAGTWYHQLYMNYLNTRM